METFKVLRGDEVHIGKINDAPAKVTSVNEWNAVRNTVLLRWVVSSSIPVDEFSHTTEVHLIPVGRESRGCGPHVESQLSSPDKLAAICSCSTAASRLSSSSSSFNSSRRIWKSTPSFSATGTPT